MPGKRVRLLCCAARTCMLHMHAVCTYSMLYMHAICTYSMLHMHAICTCVRRARLAPETPQTRARARKTNKLMRMASADESRMPHRAGDEARPHKPAQAGAGGHGWNSARPQIAKNFSQRNQMSETSWPPKETRKRLPTMPTARMRARTALLRIAISGALCCGALFNCAIGFITSPLLPVRSNSISIHLRRGGVAPQRSRQDCSLCGTRGFGCVRVAMAASVDGGR